MPGVLLSARSGLSWILLVFLVTRLLVVGVTVTVTISPLVGAFVSTTV